MQLMRDFEAEQKRIEKGFHRLADGAIEKLYESRDSYISKVQDSVSELVSEGYILEEDVDGIIEKAIFRYDDIICP